MGLKKFDLHLFDLDDTLLNTVDSYLFAYHTILQRDLNISDNKILSLQEISVFCKYFGSGNPELVFTKIFDYYRFPYTLDKECLVDLFWQEFFHRLKVFSGALDYLVLLQKDGKKLAIVSNGDLQKQEQKLKKTGLQNFFSSENCFISSDYHKSKAKPAAFMLELAINYNSILPLQTVFYGNSNIDILAAGFAKVTAVVLNIKPPIAKDFTIKCDYQFDSWQELLKFF